jgi:hypothetical protein
MKELYNVTLDPKGEVVKYRNDIETYYFRLRLRKWKWVVYLPGTKGEHFAPYELTAAEEKEIIPRIRGHLERIKYFIFFGCFPVIFERKKLDPPQRSL